MINRTITAVFKGIAICAILMIFISLITTTATFFLTYNKINSTCKLMQSELSRNNCLLDVSMRGDTGFIEQLNKICETTNVASTSDGNTSQLMTLDSIVVIGANNKCYTYVEGGNTVAHLGIDETSDDEPIGKYGDIKQIQVTFKTNFVGVWFSGTQGVNVSRQNLGTSDLTLTYYAPCLRYIK